MNEASGYKSFVHYL